MYGFDFSHVGREIRTEALERGAARVLPVRSSALVTHPCDFKRFDLTTMALADAEFTAEFQLLPSGGADSRGCSLLCMPCAGSSGRTLTLPARFRCSLPAAPTCCYGVVVWFDTEFSPRFCKEAPCTLTTSPMAEPTHWAQTVFDFKARHVAQFLYSEHA